MAIREVQPLNDEEWIQFVDELNKAPSQDKITAIHNAVESGLKLKVHR
jgi:hypothetical protein